MMRGLKYGIWCGLLLLMGGCSTVNQADVLKCASLQGYRYVYISPSGMDDVKSVSKNTEGKLVAEEVSPYDLISGTLMRSGFVKLPALVAEKNRQTLIVNYGESNVPGFLWSYNTEITIQLVDAATYEQVAKATSGGSGANRAAVVRDAINRAFKALLVP